MSLESMSEPDDIDLPDDDEGEGEVEVEGENVSRDDDEGDFEKENEDDSDNDEPFFDTQSASAASSISPGRTGQAGRSDKGNKSEEVDTEDDLMCPITPGPGSRFEFVNAPSTANGQKEDNDSESDDGESIRPDEEAGIFAEDDIEDDWIDPLASSPTPGVSPAAVLSSTSAKVKIPSPSPSPSSSPPSSSNVPQLVKSRSASKTKTSSSKSKQRMNKQVPVPVPSVRIPPQPQEHFPFPVTPVDDRSPSPRDGQRSRQTSATRVPRQPRMHTARARDGGRTQSGGVKGIFPSESS